MDPSLELLEFCAQLKVLIEIWKLEWGPCRKEERLSGSGEGNGWGVIKGKWGLKGEIYVGGRWWEHKEVSWKRI